MLTGRAKTYSSSCTQTVSLSPAILSLFYTTIVFAAKKEEERREEDKQSRNKKLMEEGCIFNTTIKFFRIR